MKTNKLIPLTLLAVLLASIWLVLTLTFFGPKYASICTAGVGNIESREFNGSSLEKWFYVTDNDFQFSSQQFFRKGDPITISYYCRFPSIILNHKAL